MAMQKDVRWEIVEAGGDEKGLRVEGVVWAKAWRWQRAACVHGAGSPAFELELEIKKESREVVGRRTCAWIPPHIKLFSLKNWDKKINEFKAHFVSSCLHCKYNVMEHMLNWFKVRRLRLPTSWWSYMKEGVPSLSVGCVSASASGLAWDYLGNRSWESKTWHWVWLIGDFPKELWHLNFSLWNLESLLYKSQIVWVNMHS